ncbi:hypothetical protein KPL78_00695 [Roseomonas sp. HJA6]|uniref:Uncharacterized protein n=1 Tax=Roseomonas alba TaxID=2846776 RepID=A0ABS7A2E9_9PROT|nr:hypothetical protein [Neoroseomonas alba]MBW6396338.1 hypothetical protein [Neoroseomonas alba]
MAEALRLQFEWRDGSIHLKSVRPVDKRAPAGDPPRRDDRSKPPIGIELELRDDERTLYRRQVGTLFPDSHEVQTGDPARPFARHPRSKPYTVEVIVPVPPKARRLVLTEHRVEQRDRAAVAAREIVHVNEPLTIGGDDTPRQGRQ